ncbi:hypothetical protein ACI65C_008906 [Semiaphis heraclei]
MMNRAIRNREPTGQQTSPLPDGRAARRAIIVKYNTTARPAGRSQKDEKTRVVSTDYRSTPYARDKQRREPQRSVAYQFNIDYSVSA